MVTRYGLDGSGIESLWSEIFRTRPDSPWGSPSPLYNGYRIFPRDKARSVWRWPLTPFRAEIKERVEHLYSPFGLARPVIQQNLTFLPLI